MANWARTDYRIEGNQEDLQEKYITSARRSTIANAL